MPTWNYVVVHARGELRFVQEEEWLLQHLADLTRQHESHRSEPWEVTDAPADFVKGQLSALVGFEISVSELKGTWKVSQNKSVKDWTGVRDGLGAETTPDASEIARLVEERARR